MWPLCQSTSSCAGVHGPSAAPLALLYMYDSADIVANCAARATGRDRDDRADPRGDAHLALRPSEIARSLAPLKRSAGRRSEQPSRRPQHVRGPIFAVAADADRPLQPRGDGGVRALAGAARRRRVRAQPLEAGHRPLPPPPPRGRAPNLALQPRPCSWRARARRAPRRLRRGARPAPPLPRRHAPPVRARRPPPHGLRVPLGARLAAEPRVGAAAGGAAPRARARLAARPRLPHLEAPAAARARAPTDGGHVCAAIVGGPRWRRRAGGAAPLEAARDRRRAAQGGLARGAGASAASRSAILSWRGGARRASWWRCKPRWRRRGRGRRCGAGAAAGGGGRPRSRGSGRRAGARARYGARSRGCARGACSRCCTRLLGSTRRRRRCAAAISAGSAPPATPPPPRAAPKACAHRAARGAMRRVAVAIDARGFWRAAAPSAPPPPAAHPAAACSLAPCGAGGRPRRGSPSRRRGARRRQSCGRRRGGSRAGSAGGVRCGGG